MKQLDSLKPGTCLISSSGGTKAISLQIFEPYPCCVRFRVGDSRAGPLPAGWRLLAHGEKGVLFHDTYLDRARTHSQNMQIE